MRRPGKLRILLLLLLGIVVLTMLSRDPGGPEIAPGSTLVLEVEGSYVEAPQPPLMARLFGVERRPFVALLSRLATARRDDRLAKVVIVIRPLQIGWGKAGELREAIGRLREAGRETVAYLDMAAFSGNREYYVASAADEIYLVPGGTLPVLGLAAEYYFLGGMWDKLGIEIDVAKAGKYKSAVESFAGTGMSEASREMANSLLDSAHDAFVDAIAEGRGLERSAVLAAIDSGPMLAAELEQLRLIDGSLHLDELLEKLGGDPVLHEDYARVDPAEVGFDPQAEVALIYGSGTVVEGRDPDAPGGEPRFASRSVSEAIQEAAESEQIDAIILRIDSPGGSALAAEQIWRALMQAREHGKPIVASFSDVAASGGYYVAVAADAIVSTGGALTGSIGVFALRPVVGGALEKIGVRLESLTRGRYADFLLAGEPLSESARARLQDIVLETYRLFVERVASGRSLGVAEVDSVAQGRVWTGRQAREIGLVDEIGGLHTAVAEVRRRLELPEDADVALIPFPGPRSIGEEIADLLRSRMVELALPRLPLPAPLRQLEALLLELPAGSPLLVPPVLVEIH